MRPACRGRNKLHVRKFAETSLAPLRLICMSRINPPTLVQISPALLQDACARASICKPAKPFPSSVIFGLASCTSRSNRRNLQKSFRLGSVRLRLARQAAKICKHQGRQSSLGQDCIIRSKPPKVEEISPPYLRLACPAPPTGSKLPNFRHVIT